MDLRQMRYFYAVAQEGHLGRAAKRLYITQPPLTRQIQALEEEVGAPLFVRSAKGMALTEAGAALMQEVPHILSLTKNAIQRAKKTGEGHSGSIDIGVFTASVLGVIPKILAGFRIERPNVAVAFKAMSKPAQIDAVLGHRLSLGFARFVPPTAGVTVETVLRERLVVALHESHQLCRQPYVTLVDLEDQPMILYPNMPLPGLEQEIEDAFRREKVRLDVAHQVEDVLTSVALVSAGFGSCISPAPAANLALPNVVYRPLRCDSFDHIDLSCLYRTDDDSPILKTFLETTRKIAALE